MSKKVEKRKKRNQKAEARKLFESHKIPNVSNIYIQGKRSTVYNLDTQYLHDNIYAAKEFKSAIERYGPPVKITTSSFDDMEDPDIAGHIRHEVNEEREWGYSKGTRVTITFKKPEGYKYSNDPQITL